MVGIILLGQAPQLSQRNVINLQNFSFGTNEYAFIDHIKNGAGSVGPFGTGFNTSTPTWPSLLDANGWPNNAAASGISFGGGFNVPDPSNFNGPYIVDFDGNGVVGFGVQFPGGSTGTFTVGTGSNGMPAPVNCSTSTGANSLSLTGTGGASKAVVYFTFTSTSSGPQGLQWIVSTTGTGGFFLKNMRVYRSADATDLAAGKIWRSGWKQPLVNLNPSAIRCMNNLGGNNSVNMRFENRTLPSSGGYLQYSQWNVSPNYGTNASGTNQYTAIAASPTAGNPLNTPASMVHGEIATLRHTNGLARVGGGAVSITSITNAANGVVTTSASHGFSTGDQIVHVMGTVNNVLGNYNATTGVTGVLGNISQVQVGMFVFGPGIQAGTTVTAVNVGAGTITLSLATTITVNEMGMAFMSMKNLHMFPCTITVTGATTYQLNVNTTSLGTFATGTGSATQYATLQVGSGNDRTAYPCIFSSAAFPLSYFGSTFLNANDYKTWYFDKTVAGKTDGAGNWVFGAWLLSRDNANFNILQGHWGEFPIEVFVALVNELNAMSLAQGKPNTIGLWMNIPAMGLSTMDPDYTTASDWAVNAVDVVMNPSSVVRTNGFSALGYSGVTQLNQPNLILEYSNELWNSGTNAQGVSYLITKGQQRWGTATLPFQAWQDLKSLRSTCWTRDVKASNPPGLSRIKFIIGCQLGSGFRVGDFAANYATAFGGAVTTTPKTIGDWYTNDSLVTGGSWGTPISNHDGVCGAPYFDPPDVYYSTTTGIGTFTDDSAMYNGINNSGNSGGNYSGAANQSQALTNFVAKVVSGSDVLQTAGALTTTTEFCTNLPTGKVYVSYEGGPDWQITAGGNQAGHVLTSGDALFANAAVNSSQWATAQTNFFNSVSAIPKSFMSSIYIWINGRWAYCAPDTYAGGVEGAALTVNSPVWIAMGNRNQALSP